MKQLPPEEWGNEVRTLLPNDRRYLVGVSGGRDSIVLLHWLLARGYRKLVVCHLEHGLRGRAGKADARFVERLASKHRLPTEVGTADVAALAAQRKQSIETAAREARLAFFSRIARRRRCATIFLGHQADDQVETFLLNLFRGAGSRGLGAMRSSSRHGQLELVRPLLGVWRSEIDRYVSEHQLNFREDTTNRQLGARRNRVRHEIVPWLEKQFGRNLRQNIWRAASIFAEEDAFLESHLPEGLTSAQPLPVKTLRALPIVLQRRAILAWLRAQETPEVDFTLIESVRALLDPKARISKINLPRDRHLRRRAGRLFLD
jgi:tRNA(Ile)-lysidine synthase